MKNQTPSFLSNDRTYEISKWIKQSVATEFILETKKNSFHSNIKNNLYSVTEIPLFIQIPTKSKVESAPN